MFLSDKDFDELTKLPVSTDSSSISNLAKFDKNNIVYEDDELLVINKPS